MELENKVLSREIGQVFYGTGMTLATAESCTGGRLAESIIFTAGSSEYFKGGIIAYSDEVKSKILRVDADLIKEKNAVSEEVAIAMVQGVLQTLDADYAISSTGFAGPGGGTPDIPVGTIWLACGNKDKIVTFKMEEDNGRDINLGLATTKALSILVEFMSDTNGK